MTGELTLSQFKSAENYLEIRMRTYYADENEMYVSLSTPLHVKPKIYYQAINDSWSMQFIKPEHC